MARLDFDAIRRENKVSAVVGAVTQLKRVGRELRACCPLHNDSSPSFYIFDDDRRWICFAGCGGGDVLDIAQRLYRVGPKEAAAMLAGAEMPSVPPILIPADDGRDKVRQAREIVAATLAIAGTPAERYLRCRAITISLPDCLRYAVLRHPDTRHQHPCLVAAVVDIHGEVTGAHRIFLNDEGTGKLAGYKAKLSKGKIAGSAIRLAPVARSLIVAEGIEDALSLMEVLGHACWAAGGAGMLHRMQFPAGVRSVAIGGDSDDAGRAAARKAAETFAHRGIEARTFFPLSDAKDFNAELMEGASA